MKKINKDLESFELNKKNNNYKKNSIILINLFNPYKSLKLILFLNPNSKVINNFNNLVKEKDTLLSQLKNIKKKYKDLDNNNKKEKKQIFLNKPKETNKSKSNKKINVKNKSFLISKKYNQAWNNAKYNIKGQHKKLNNLLVKSSFFTKWKISSSKKKQPHQNKEKENYQK